jgi:dihydrofolate reductase
MQYMTLDGVIGDPAGVTGAPGSGWLYRHGPEMVAGDKFELGPVMDTGVLLLGRNTWAAFSKIWPSRTTEFAAKMNAMPKLVASRTLTSVDQWQNSALVEDDLVTTVRKRKAEQDIVITGSPGIVRTLVEHDLVDEFRFVVVPSVVGTGERLFGEPRDLRLVAVEQKGAGVFLRYRRQDS